MSVPPNFRWQVWLERRFPGYVVEDGRRVGGKGEKGLPVVEVGSGGEVSFVLFFALISFSWKSWGGDL